MIKSRLFYFLLIPFFITIFTACSQKNDKPAKKKSAAIKENTISDINYNINVGELAITSTESKFAISTYEFDERKSLRFLKKPQTGVTTLQQIFVDPTNKDETSQIILLIFKFHNHENAEDEAKINLNLLENLLKRSHTDVVTFDKNLFGDESLGLVLSNRPYPIFLYCRIGNIFIKLNGGKNRQNEEVVNILKIIETKLKIKSGRN